MVEGRMGTEGFEAPEVLQRAVYDGVPADIFAVGVTLFFAHNGFKPFKRAVFQDPQYGQINDGSSEYWA